MQGFHRSTDAGQTFSQVDNGFYCEQSFYSFSLAVSPKNPDEIFAGCENLYRHNPAGSWESVSMYAPGSSHPQIMVYHPDVHDIRYLADGTFLAVTDGGLHHNLGGTNWVQLNNNLNVGQSYRVGVMPGDYDHVCTGRQDNGADIKAGASAAFQTAFDKDGMGCFWNSDGTRWYSTAQMGDFKYCDYTNGQTGNCTYGNGANNHPKEKGSWDTPWSAHPTDPAVLFAGMNNMWRSPDKGATWTQMGTLGGTGGIRNFTVAPSNSQVIYVAKDSKIFRTTDGGSAWQDVTGTLAGIPTDVAVSAANPDHVWVTLSGYDATRKVYRSVNGGQAWTNETASGLPNLPANTVVLDDLGSNGVYVGMDIGVFYKRDGMASWQDFSGGLPNVQVRELEMGRKGAGTADRMLFAATFGRGVLRTRLWDDLPAHSRRAGAPPALREFSASFSGSTLHLGFRLDGGEGTGATALRLARLDGKILHGEETLQAGYHERHIDLAGQGKGLCLLILENATARIAKPIVIP